MAKVENRTDLIVTSFEGTRQIHRSGAEYWMARDLQRTLGYETWENFLEVIGRAQKACEGAKVDSSYQFRETTKMVPIGSGAQRALPDFYLSRYACYLIAMNGDPQKTAIAVAQNYFAIQTRKQELAEETSPTERRMELRRRVTIAVKQLNSAAKQSGVQDYALFHDAGYRGLYTMGLADLRRRKGLGHKEDVLDRAGRAELAANEFRITQTEQKLTREKIRGQGEAIATHKNVGGRVRDAIRKIGGTMPEDLAPEESIKKLSREQKKLAKKK